MIVNRLNPDNFDSVVLNTESLVVVTFFADWCGPCHDFQPKLRALAKHFDGSVVFGKVDIDEHRELSQRFAVQGVPYTLIFKAGTQVDLLVGNLAIDILREKIERQNPAPIQKPTEKPVTSEPPTSTQPRKSLLDKLIDAIKSLFTSR